MTTDKREKILKIIEKYGEAVDCQGWEIPERFEALAQLEALINEGSSNQDLRKTNPIEAGSQSRPLTELDEKEVEKVLLENTCSISKEMCIRISKLICSHFSKPIRPPKINGEYQCEHAKNKTLDSNCLWCEITVLENIAENYRKLKAEKPSIVYPEKIENISDKRLMGIR